MSVVATLVVTVLHVGVDVTEEVLVTVVMPRTLLQKGVATFCACMMLTIPLTAWQLMGAWSGDP